MLPMAQPTWQSTAEATARGLTPLSVKFTRAISERIQMGGSMPSIETLRLKFTSLKRSTGKPVPRSMIKRSIWPGYAFPMAENTSFPPPFLP